MARAVYQFELNDPDISWLISKFQENHPEFMLFDTSSLPILLIKGEKNLALPENLLPENSPPLPEENNFSFDGGSKEHEDS